MVIFQLRPAVHSPQESSAKSQSAAPADKPLRLLLHLPSTCAIPISTLNFQESPDHYGRRRKLTLFRAGWDTHGCQTAADILDLHPTGFFPAPHASGAASATFNGR